MPWKMNSTVIKNELLYKAVRSSGAGGQNVNKVASKTVLFFPVVSSQGLTQDEKAVLQEKLSNRISKEGVLVLECDETRSQLKNKEIVTRRLFYVLENALKKEKQRIATKIPKAVIRKRLNDKKIQSDKKKNRRFKF